jgi:hypothetical protein
MRKNEAVNNFTNMNNRKGGHAQCGLEFFCRHSAVVIAVEKIENLTYHLKVRVPDPVPGHRHVSSLLRLAFARANHDPSA